MGSKAWKLPGRSKCGGMSMKAGDKASAAAYLKRASGIYERKDLDATAEYAELLINTGVLILELGGHSSALTYFERAAIIMKKTLPPTHPHLAAVYQNITVCHTTLGNTSAAAKARSTSTAVERRSQVACAGPGCKRKLKEDGTALTMCAACLCTTTAAWHARPRTGRLATRRSARRCSGKRRMEKSI